jgi:hypothetical protein
MYNTCIIILRRAPILFRIMQWYAISKLQFYFLKFEPHVRAMARAPTLVGNMVQRNGLARVGLRLEVRAPASPSVHCK